MAESEKILQLIETVMIYGNPESPFWFVGLEESDEAGEVSLNEHLRRLELLIERGSVSLRDAVGLPRYFPTDEKMPPERQPTWEGYVKLRFGLKGLVVKPSQIRHYQGHGLGELKGGDTCLLELLPLPRKNRAENWTYSSLSDLDFLKSKSKYLKHVAPQRINRIITLIERYKPMVVTFFGADCKNIFKKYQSLELELIEDGKSGRPVSYTYIGRTILVFSHHPVARGITNQYWQSLGSFIQKKTSSVEILYLYNSDI